jgi:hypothetical protein
MLQAYRNAVEVLDRPFSASPGILDVFTVSGESEAEDTSIVLAKRSDI